MAPKKSKNRRLSTKVIPAAQRTATTEAVAVFPETDQASDTEENPAPVAAEADGGNQKPKKGRPGKASVKVVAKKANEGGSEESPQKQTSGKRVKKTAKSFTPGSAVPVKKRGRQTRKVNEPSETVAVIPSDNKKGKATKKGAKSSETAVPQMNEDPFEEQNEEPLGTGAATSSNETPVAKKKGRAASKTTTPAKETTDDNKTKTAVTPTAGRRGKTAAVAAQPVEVAEPEVLKTPTPKGRAVNKRGKKEAASDVVSETPKEEEEQLEEVPEEAKGKKGGKRGKAAIVKNSETASSEEKDEDKKSPVKKGKVVEPAVPKETKKRGGRKQTTPIKVETESAEEVEKSTKEEAAPSKSTAGKRGKKAAAPTQDVEEPGPSEVAENIDDASDNLSADAESQPKPRGRKRKEVMPVETTKVARKAVKSK